MSSSTKKEDGKFKEGNSIATAKAGKKHKSTIIKELLAENIETLDDKLFEISKELLSSSDIKIKAFAWKELIKYRLPKNVLIEGLGNSNCINVYVSEYI